MKFYYTKRSPYARKAIVMASEKKINNLQLVEVDLAAKPEDLFSANPLGKVPALLTDEGKIYSDSPVICEYIESLNIEPKFFPTNVSERIDLLNIAAIADGLMESGISIMIERNKPVEKQTQMVFDKHQLAVNNALEYLDKYYAGKKINLDIATLGVGCALDYLSFRHPDLNWQNNYSNLKNLFDELNKFDSFKNTAPKM